MVKNVSSEQDNGFSGTTEHVQCDSFVRLNRDVQVEERQFGESPLEPADGDSSELSGPQLVGVFQRNDRSVGPVSSCAGMSTSDVPFAGQRRVTNTTGAGTRPC